MTVSQPKRGELLVAILNDSGDLDILRTQGWYRIPVASVEKWLLHRWPPRWLAWYQTKNFGAEAYAVRYFGEVHDIRIVPRQQLFPEYRNDPKAHHRYYQLFVKSIETLPQPIFSRRLRRIVFIPTTWNKFFKAAEVNDLYDESPLEDRLWAEFKRHQIPAERQEFVIAREHDYALDFAIYCAKGKLDVETDGDFWHANSEKAAQDNLRDNDLKTAGWRVLRFNTKQIQEQMFDYCIQTITQNIDGFGGLDEGRLVPRKILLNVDSVQTSLFDEV
jgi:very-short-patch-repair endonuclease